MDELEFAKYMNPPTRPRICERCGFPTTGTVAWIHAYDKGITVGTSEYKPPVMICDNCKKSFELWWKEGLMGGDEKA